jgi:CheY-like chemotaxis protein
MSTRLLVVDDDPRTLLALSDALRFRLADTTIMTASTGEEALAFLARDPYGLDDWSRPISDKPGGSMGPAHSSAT